jgi:hypothetical protein
MDTLRLGRWQEALAGVECDALIVDAPYSARTHSGHDRGLDTGRYDAINGTSADRRAITYEGWTPEDVAAFVQDWSQRTRGWIVTITDHVLAPVWADALADQGRYVFAPLPWVAAASRVRLAGDGPSSWTCCIIVARPRTGNDRNGRPYSKWGTLPGAYLHTSDRPSHIGGKPLALMEALVRDYSRPGDLVCDPCAGYGTTLAAALRQGRRAIGSEMDPETHARGLEYLDRNGRARDLFEAVEQVTAAQELPW